MGGGVSVTTKQIIEHFWSTANARDWESFAALLHPDMLYLVPQTRERVRGRTGFVELFRTWPGQWRADVQLLIAEENQAVSIIDFHVSGETSTGISFFEFSAGRVSRITDYWPNPYEPPARATPYIERY
jgi:ketosteroid isomerase-like protein